MAWHFLMIVRESPMTVTEGKCISLLSFNACRLAKASIANGDETFLCKTIFVAMSLPDRPQTTRPDADLKFMLSKAGQAESSL
ncbi:hypothetical protein CXB51_024994 [Gossypium anomalum]|uniref:Uncharacterized protein n=1 Tax=Gossypium anomalum TaxID=47600 RepID=A0A8J5YET0_9ROSI|nr:hypothetical protein CXB51_024994 [Gossypium anomalum]